MPQVSYFIARANTSSITGADATDLMSHSAVTHTAVAPGAAPVAMAHPTHPHAHISKEGFQAAPIVPLTMKEKVDYSNLKSKPPAKLTGAERDTIAGYTRRDTGNDAYGTESLHVDPATRGAYADPMSELVDPHKGPYTDRKFHSQFEDSEIAVMALVYALNTPAGKDALNHLRGADTRAVIHSISAAKALIAPVKMNNPPAVLSPHALRGAAAQVVLRGKGAAGAAVPAIQAKKALPASMPIAATTTVLSSDGTELTVVTHYPSHQLPKAAYKDAAGNWSAGLNKKSDPIDVLITQDTVEFSNGGALVDGKTYAPAAAAPLRWVNDTPMINLGITSVRGTSSAGQACITCGQQHGTMPSVKNKWFQCNKCGGTYCPVHAAALVAALPPAAAGGKKCKARGCVGGVASWIF